MKTRHLVRALVRPSFGPEAVWDGTRRPAPPQDDFYRTTENFAVALAAAVFSTAM